MTRCALTKAKPRAGEHPTEIFGPSSMAGLTTGRELQNIVDQLVNEQIILSRQIDPEAAALLQKNTVRYMGLKPDGAEASKAQTMAPFLFMMLLFIGIMGISQMLLNSTLEEKSNRIYEVLLSSVSPMQLMTGKIIGICAVGFSLLLLVVGRRLDCGGCQWHGRRGLGQANRLVLRLLLLWLLDDCQRDGGHWEVPATRSKRRRISWRLSP